MVNILSPWLTLVASFLETPQLLVKVDPAGYYGGLKSIILIILDQ